MALCGVVGLGSLVAEGRTEVLPDLRALAPDPRWRIREAAAIALQRWGRVDMGGLIAEMRRWSEGSHLEQRAAVAALCEPDLLRDRRGAGQVLVLLDRVTRSLSRARDRRDEGFRILRQALGYCWSVGVAAVPEDGLRRLDHWMASDDPDVRRVMRENLKKKRLTSIAGDRLERWRDLVGAS